MPPDFFTGPISSHPTTDGSDLRLTVCGVGFLKRQPPVIRTTVNSKGNFAMHVTMPVTTCLRALLRPYARDTVLVYVSDYVSVHVTPI